MLDKNLYRPPQSSLLGGDQTKTKRMTFIRRFLITLAWAFPVFATISVLNTQSTEWLAVIAGSFLISLFCGIVAMCIPTRFKTIFVPVGILAGFALALLG